MRHYQVIFSPEAQTDLWDLYDYIADEAGAAVALAYVERLEVCCRGLATFPERGIVRSDIRSGIRVIGFERRVSIAFHVDSPFVVIDRIFYGGRDIAAAFP